MHGMKELSDISPWLKARGFLSSLRGFPASKEIAQKAFAFGVLHRLHRHETFPEPQGRCEALRLRLTASSISWRAISPYGDIQSY